MNFFVSRAFLIGVPVALAAARFASSQISGLLFGISATDPITITLAAALLISVAAIASYSQHGEHRTSTRW